MSFKKLLILFFGVVLIFVIYKVSVSYNSKTVEINKDHQLVTPQSKFDYATNKIGPSIVSVQSFSAGRLLSSGSGMILTEDGLVMTLNSLVPTQADFYQVAIEGKLNRGRVVSRNIQSNLAIIAVDDSDFLPAGLEPSAADTVKDFLIVGLDINLGRSELISNQISANLTHVNDSKIVNSIQSGSAIIDEYGRIVGLLDSTGQYGKIIDANTIEKSFLNYLTTIKK